MKSDNQALLRKIDIAASALNRRANGSYMIGVDKSEFEATLNDIYREMKYEESKNDFSRSL